MNQDELCSICERQPEDLLVLLCRHNLCVSCATEIYRLNDCANPFICEICLSETPLDEETVQHFESQTVRHSRAKTQISEQDRPPKPSNHHSSRSNYSQHPPPPAPRYQE